MKKVISIILAAIMLLSVTGCQSTRKKEAVAGFETALSEAQELTDKFGGTLSKAKTCVEETAPEEIVEFGLVDELDQIINQVDRYFNGYPEMEMAKKTADIESQIVEIENIKKEIQQNIDVLEEPLDAVSKSKELVSSFKGAIEEIRCLVYEGYEYLKGTADRYEKDYQNDALRLTDDILAASELVNFTKEEDIVDAELFERLCKAYEPFQKLGFGLPHDFPPTMAKTNDQVEKQIEEMEALRDNMDDHKKQLVEISGLVVKGMEEREAKREKNAKQLDKLASDVFGRFRSGEYPVSGEPRITGKILYYVQGFKDGKTDTSAYSGAYGQNYGGSFCEAGRLASSVSECTEVALIYAECEKVGEYESSGVAGYTTRTYVSIVNLKKETVSEPYLVSTEEPPQTIYVEPQRCGGYFKGDENMGAGIYGDFAIGDAKLYIKELMK